MYRSAVQYRLLCIGLLYSTGYCVSVCSTVPVVILVRFQWKLNFLHRFSKNPQISNLTKILPVEAELFHVDRQTDMAELIVAFRSFASSPKDAHFPHISSVNGKLSENISKYRHVCSCSLTDITSPKHSQHLHSQQHLQSASSQTSTYRQNFAQTRSASPQSASPQTCTYRHNFIQTQSASPQTCTNRQNFTQTQSASPQSAASPVSISTNLHVPTELHPNTVSISTVSISTNLHLPTELHPNTVSISTVSSISSQHLHKPARTDSKSKTKDIVGMHDPASSNNAQQNINKPTTCCLLGTNCY
jgi:hypothetical protein